MVQSIVTSAAQVMSDCESELFKESVRSEIQRCRDCLDALRRGELHLPFDDFGRCITAVENTRKRLRATSVCSFDGAWWGTAAGTRYWLSNVDALKRKVRIERVFIYKEWDEALEGTARTQALAGVTVSRIDQKTISPEFLLDMIVFDDALAYESHDIADGVPLTSRFTVTRSEIERKIQQFERIKTSAVEYDAKASTWGGQ